MTNLELEDRIRRAFAEEQREMPESGLAAIAARRARGERVALLAARSPHLHWVRWAMIGSAAALLGWLGFSGLRADRSRGPGVVNRLANAALAPDPLFAQGSAHPSYPVVSYQREIRPGEWSYATLRHDEVFSESTTVYRSRLTRAMYRETPAWLMLSRPVPDRPSEWRDSVWLDTAEVRQLARSVEVMSGEGRIVEEYRRDEILRGFVTRTGTTWTVIRREDPTQNPQNGYILQSDVLGLALRRAPLDRDWRGSIALVTWPFYSRAPKQWYDLEVVGEQSITVPAGTFSCWKIRLGPPGRRQDSGVFFWISQREQWMVKWGANGSSGPYFRSILVSAKEE